MGLVKRIKAKSKQNIGITAKIYSITLAASFAESIPRKTLTIIEPKYPNK